MKEKEFKITEYDFFRIYLSLLIRDDKPSLINKKRIEKDIFGFINNEKYFNIFKQIKLTINENKVNLDDAFLNAYIYNIIILDKNNKDHFVINIDKDNALNILSKYNDEYIILIEQLINDIYEENFTRIQKYK